MRLKRSSEGARALLVQRIDSVLRSVVDSPSPSASSELRAIVGRLGELFVRDQDRLIGVQQLLASSHALAERALHSAAVAKLLAVAEGLSADAQASIVAAALTADVAIIEGHDRLATHAGLLVDSQRQMIATHPEAAARWLRSVGVDDPLWLSAVEMHHERLDGSGYPLGLSAESIPIGPRIVALADTFTAMLRPRADRPAFLARDALRELAGAEASRFDTRLAHVLARQLGAYPPGTLVKLANGEVGVCVRRTHDARKPVLRAVVDSSGQPYASPKRRDPADSASKIVEVLHPDRHRGVCGLVNRLWKKSLNLVGDRS